MPIFAFVVLRIKADTNTSIKMARFAGLVLSGYARKSMMMSVTANAILATKTNKHIIAFQKLYA